MHNKTILITGSNGLLGQKLVYALVKRGGWNIIATSVGENRLLHKSGYTYASLDITDRAAVTEAVNRFRPDVLINTAAMTNVDACETKKEECLALNVNAVQHLVDACTAMAAADAAVNTHFIHLSTDFIFDGTAGPYREDAAPNPLSYYAWSKTEAERIVLGSSLKVAVLRTMLVYGVVDNMSRSNIVLWAKGALAKGQEIPVVDDQFRNPTLAEDLAEACILAAEKNATGIYHISGDDFMSILELVQRVARFWKLDESLIKPVKSDTLSQPAKRPPRTGFILDKAKHDLGYKPHTFEEGLAVVDAQLQTIVA
jgi:dTDP-4-dehydrorhamnose reductase